MLIDEYQDTNKPQFEFVSAIAKKHQDVCVVGDDDQSIYSWRGAQPENLGLLNKDFPSLKESWTTKKCNPVCALSCGIN